MVNTLMNNEISRIYFTDTPAPMMKIVRPRTAGQSPLRRAGIDVVKADVDGEREVGFREPARAAAVVDRPQPLFVAR